LFQKAKSKHNKQIGAKYIPAHSVQTAHKNEIQESLANAKVSVRQPCTSKTDFDMK